MRNKLTNEQRAKLEGFVHLRLSQGKLSMAKLAGLAMEAGIAETISAAQCQAAKNRVGGGAAPVEKPDAEEVSCETVSLSGIRKRLEALLVYLERYEKEQKERLSALFLA